ncbi:hypothetical protein [Streptomyces sp. NL15-2K]|uniref:hypothetical protein n=1 Tax=Streptomyces sp. NL15-2K TaxID=376149 RepID=UPI000F58DE52|nr:MULTISPECIES: hypothetical protein [Actinomycetes]WKX14160.1 hypothetical protein Q4V64_44245 [Kutzneria buriramensis]GCB44682.1 hypothetical protein SNL152K_1972 [Streptomyces sp. NL15-2K]
MAAVKISGTRLTVEFSERESRWTGRDSVTVPLAAVHGVTAVERPLRVVRGARNGYQSAFTKIGTWGIFVGPRQLVAARRSEPGLHILLDKAASGGEFDEIVVSVDDAANLAQRIAQGSGGAA